MLTNDRHVAFSGWMYSYFGALAVPAFVLGSLQILAAVLTALLYAHLKWKNRNTFDVTTPVETGTRC